MNNVKFRVAVRCFTYNHSKYITETMDGFVLQHTSFPYVCCIVDDASTDGEQDVLCKYVRTNFVTIRTIDNNDAVVLHAQHKENTNCYFSIVLLKKNLYGTVEGAIKKMDLISEWNDTADYQCLCEGDDWWISPEKIQKQVEALDAHPDVNICCCGAIRYLNGKEQKRVCPRNENSIIPVEEVIAGGGGFVSTETIMLRRGFDNNDYAFWRYMSLDYVYQIHGSLNGGMYFISEFMTGHRVFADGSWTSRFKNNYPHQVKHGRKIITMLSLLDKDTSYKYSEVIERAIDRVSVKVLRASLYGGKMKVAFHSISFSRRMKMLLYFLKSIF